MILTYPKIEVRTKWVASEQSDSWLSTFVCWYLLMDTVNMFGQDVLLLTGTSYTLFRMALMGMLGFVLFMGLYVQQKRILYSFLFMEVVALFPYLYSMMLGIPLTKISDWMVTGLAICWPIGFCTYHVKDKNILYDKLQKYSWFILLFSVLVMLFQPKAHEADYNMHFSYAVLLTILLHGNQLIRTRNVRYVLPLGFELYMLLSFGSRGAIACIAMFVLLKLLENVKDIRIKVVFILGGLLAVVVGFYIINTFGKDIYAFLYSMGIKSRTVKMFLLGKLGSTDTRNQLWIDTVDAIFTRPFMGWGLRGATKVILHPYPHQFFYDLWLTFGIPIGTVLIGLLCWPLRKLIYYDGSKGDDLMQIFFSIAFVYLQFTSTLFTSYYFFIMMGLFLSKKAWQKGELKDDKTVEQVDSWNSVSAENNIY